MAIRGFNGKMKEYVGQIPYAAGKRGFLELPADRMIKTVHLDFYGKYNLTYSAGTPMINHGGVANAMFKNIAIEEKGGDAFRSYLGVVELINDQKLDFTDRGALLYKGNSATLGSATSADSHVVAATTQDNAFFESYPIFMENRKSLEYFRTYFSTMGNKAAKVIIDFNSPSQILDAEDASTNTPAAFTLDGVVDVYIEKVDQLIVPSESMYREVNSYDQIVPNGVTSGSRFVTSPEGQLQGFWIRAVQGATEIRFTHEEMLSTVIEFKFDGETIWKSNLLAAACHNMHSHPLLDVIRGTCYVDLLNSRTWDTGLYTGEGSNTKSLEVFITCPVANQKFYFGFKTIKAPRQPQVAKAS